MIQRGRVSTAQLAVVGAATPRLAPPGGLSDGERGVWLATVNSRPADWFGSEHVPLLVNYARHACRADVLAEQIAEFQPDWLKTDEGVRRYERLCKMARDESTACSNLARHMRITHQSLYRADKAATVVSGSARQTPWQTQDEPEDD